MQISIAGILLNLTELDVAGISAANIRQLKRREQVEYSRSVTGKPVEVVYESLPPKLKDKVMAYYGCPYEYIKEQELKKLLKLDMDAVEFYHNHKVGEQHLCDVQIERCLNMVKWLNYVISIDCMGKRAFKLLGVETRENMWVEILKQLTKANAPIPKNYSNLKQLLKKYNSKNGKNYEVLISKKIGNQNTAKITEDGKQYIIANYSLPIKLTPQDVWLAYNAKAAEQGWKYLDDARTVQYFLMRPDIKREWYGPRHGWRKATEIYGYTQKTTLPTHRDALWEGDGTKMNFYYEGENGIKADMNIYLVVDVFSEMILGYDIAKTENSESMFGAYRMALETTQAKPYELKYDNQGGHLKLNNWFNKFAKIGCATQPYNAKSKTIENIISRLQQGPMRKYWYFTGQNVQAKKEDSKPNMEFILANAKNLPTLKEVEIAMQKCIEIWNLERKEKYFNTTNPKHNELTYLDMIELFWMESKPITYHASGLKLTHKNRDYFYEVLINGKPDEAFMVEFTKAKFTVKFDPKDFSHVRLYANTPQGLRFVAVAEPKIEIPRAKIDQKEGDRNTINQLLDLRKTQIEQMKMGSKLREIKTGLSPKKLLQEPSYAGYLKDLSNEDGEEDLLQSYNKVNIKNIV